MPEFVLLQIKMHTKQIMRKNVIPLLIFVVLSRLHRYFFSASFSNEEQLGLTPMRPNPIIGQFDT